MISQAECWWWKHEVLSLNHECPHEKLGTATDTCTPARGRGCGDRRPLGLAGLWSSTRLSERCCLSQGNEVRGVRAGHLPSSLAPCAHTHVHTPCMHTHILVYEQTMKTVHACEFRCEGEDYEIINVVLWELQPGVKKNENIAVYCEIQIKGCSNE